MSPDDALKVLMEAASHADFDWCLRDHARAEMIREALSFFKGKHVFVSKFKPGDEVHVITRFTGHKPPQPQWCVEQSGYLHWVRFWDDEPEYGRTNCYGDEEWTKENRCLPTRAEAETECARRNLEAKP